MTLEVDVLSLFPAMLEGPLDASIPGRIIERGLATLRIHDLRRWGLGRHRSEPARFRLATRPPRLFDDAPSSLSSYWPPPGR